MTTVPETAWCPGCGNFPIREALAAALAATGIPPEKIVLVSGIGQGAKMPQYLPYSYFNGLHGRSLPVATGIKLARPDLTVVAVSGDGCMYGEGGNHFLHALRRNLDLTIVVTDNQVYGLTKGQSSPTSAAGTRTALAPGGNPNRPLPPLALALAAGAPFAARGFAGEKDHLRDLLLEAVRFPGTAVVDILQPCVSFNKVNTWRWYADRVYRLAAPAPDRSGALRLAEAWEEGIPLGVLHRDDSRTPRGLRPLLGEAFPEKRMEAFFTLLLR